MSETIADCSNVKKGNIPAKVSRPNTRASIIFFVCSVVVMIGLPLYLLLFLSLVKINIEIIYNYSRIK
jgi:hypothetical protein